MFSMDSDSLTIRGHGVNGALTRYALLRPDQIYWMPDSFTLEEAALSEPFAAAVQAVTEITEIRLGDVALVSGPGPIGLLCLKLLVAEGVNTIVAGAAGDEGRLDAARAIGASATVNVSNQNLSEFVREHTQAGASMLRWNVQAMPAPYEAASSLLDQKACTHKSVFVGARFSFRSTSSYINSSRYGVRSAIPARPGTA